jgi:hypothetical protein
VGLREWVGRLGETDRKAMTAWGFIAGLVVVGILVPAIGWAIALVIAGVTDPLSGGQAEADWPGHASCENRRYLVARPQ